MQKYSNILDYETQIEWSPNYTGRHILRCQKTLPNGKHKKKEKKKSLAGHSVLLLLEAVSLSTPFRRALTEGWTLLGSLLLCTTGNCFSNYTSVVRVSSAFIQRKGSFGQKPEGILSEIEVGSSRRYWF
ncbi:hypothetical protein CEXT_625411 [Caerostris extrusa]|uniref:Uncharacterized protein n=1 Tax=Caerostris extrusa TaxID=172846 RepID=A0AAV4TZD9_CAEEX|nr:hypothetical protein CEXT_625411 [Caerostris extrusa]